MNRTFIIDADVCYIIRGTRAGQPPYYFCGGNQWCQHPWHAAVFRTFDVATDQAACFSRPHDVVLDVCTLAGSICDFEKANPT